MLQDEAAAVVRPAHAREEGHAEKVDAQSLVGVNEGGHIAHHDVAHLHHPELDRGRAGDAVCGRYPDVIVPYRGMNAEPRGIAGAQRNLGRAGIHDQLQAAAINSGISPKMPITAWSKAYAARVDGAWGGSNRRCGERRRGCCGRSIPLHPARHQNTGQEHRDGENDEPAHDPQHFVDVGKQSSPPHNFGLTRQAQRPSILVTMI